MARDPRVDFNSHIVREMAALSQAPSIVSVTSDVILIRIMFSFRKGTLFTPRFMLGCIYQRELFGTLEDVLLSLEGLRRLNIVHVPHDDYYAFKLTDSMRDLIREFMMRGDDFRRLGGY